MKKSSTLLQLLFAVFCFSALFYSCEEEATKPETKEETKTDPKTEMKDQDGVGGNVMKFQGEIFSIPSPIQSAIMLRNANVAYNPEILNTTSSAKDYVSEHQKALNLGIYGADLSYVSSYQNTQSILEYFNVINNLSNDLQISSEIGQNLIERFGDNLDNLDSLYVLNGAIYKAANQYLKENDRTELASLILTGGWVEALHISLSSTDSKEVRNRIGEQKSALNSLINLLNSYQDGKIDNIIGGLKDLKMEFDKLENKYIHADPIHDQSTRTTHLKSATQVEVSDEQFETIKTKISELRNLIIK